ncbi:MAG: hypothetical protein ACRDKI_07795 [Solirubrobacterales bacterium]
MTIEPFTSRSRAILIAVTLLTALATAGVAAGQASAAAWPPAGFSEATASQNAKFADVQASAVTVDAPLPASFAAHPAACDKLTFLRIKRIGGPAIPSDADKVLIAQPGVLEGASAFQDVGSNLVHRAWSERGKNIEFWAVDRRANCLEDVNGLRLAKATNDPKKLIDYYYKGASYGGQTFAGFLKKNSPDVKWLAKMGMDQTLRDWNEVITRGIPLQSDRQQKVYCGGHSLGGLITGAYADYDFDGNPATLADAGYNQCKGYFGLDTLVTDDPVKLRELGAATGLSALASGVTGGYDALLQSGAIAPFVSLPGINPEVMYLLTGVGAATQLAPTTESGLVKYLPADSDVQLAYKLYFSRDLSTFLSGSPGLADFRMTNQALLGTFIDDNSMPLGIVQTSVGFFDGGPVADKNFPLPDVLGNIPGLEWLTNGILGTGHLAIPTDYGRHCLLLICWYTPGTGPLYKWRNYNQLGGVSIPRDFFGRPYTDKYQEVTDINDVADSLAALPMNFVEAYFPLKLALDSFLGLAGATGTVPGQVHPEGVAARPNINILTADGPVAGLARVFSPESPVIPGYQHLDVLTAAPTQNNGQPEPAATKLLDYLY